MFGHQDEPSSDDAVNGLNAPLSAPPVTPPASDQQGTITPPATDLTAGSSSSTIIQPETKPEMPPELEGELPAASPSDSSNESSVATEDSAKTSDTATTSSSATDSPDSDTTAAPIVDSNGDLDLPHNEVETPANHTPLPTMDDELKLPEPALPLTSPSLSSDSSDSSSQSTPPAPVPAANEGKEDEDLLEIKQEALEQLSPLVGQLQQSPEEKFHTTMMMIQASDDQSLIQSAFEAAKQITDDKARAQALLDIVNEINYFTQHQPVQ